MSDFIEILGFLVVYFVIVILGYLCICSMVQINQNNVMLKEVVEILKVDND